MWLSKKVAVDVTISQFSFTSFICLLRSQYIKTISDFLALSPRKKSSIIEKQKIPGMAMRPLQRHASDYAARGRRLCESLSPTTLRNLVIFRF